MADAHQQPIIYQMICSVFEKIAAVFHSKLRSEFLASLSGLLLKISQQQQVFRKIQMENQSKQLYAGTAQSVQKQFIVQQLNKTLDSIIAVVEEHRFTKTIFEWEENALDTADIRLWLIDAGHLEKIASYLQQAEFSQQVFRLGLVYQNFEDVLTQKEIREYLKNSQQFLLLDQGKLLHLNVKSYVQYQEQRKKGKLPQQKEQAQQVSFLQLVVNHYRSSENGCTDPQKYVLGLSPFLLDHGLDFHRILGDLHARVLSVLQIEYSRVQFSKRNSPASLPEIKYCQQISKISLPLIECVFLAAGQQIEVINQQLLYFGVRLGAVGEAGLVYFAMLIAWKVLSAQQLTLLTRELRKKSEVQLRYPLSILFKGFSSRLRLSDSRAELVVTDLGQQEPELINEELHEYCKFIISYIVEKQQGALAASALKLYEEKMSSLCSQQCSFQSSRIIEEADKLVLERINLKKQLEFNKSRLQQSDLDFLRYLAEPHQTLLEAHNRHWQPLVRETMEEILAAC